jgi:hypothetical protein
MTTKLSTDNIQQSAIDTITSQAVAAAGGASVKISSIAVANSSYTILDDTAVSTNGGFIVITGTNFASGCQVVIDDVAANSTTFVNSTTVRAQVGPKVAGTYNVYLTNPDGGTAIRVNGITYSGTPTWVTDSTLTAGEADVFISYNLNATGATSYSLQAGSSLPPGLTLSSNGYLSGTVTGIDELTTYNFTIDAIDDELQDSPRSFSVSISAGDAFFNYVSALITGDTPTTNTFLTDASTNNFTATPVADTRPTRFSPFTPGYYSNFFDGSGDYLTTASSASFAFGTGDYTIEGWIFSTSNAYQRIFWAGDDKDNLEINSNSVGDITFYNGTTPVTTSGGIFQSFRWNHMAVVRSSGTVTVYLNGVSVLTQATTANTTTNRLFGIGGNGVNGYFVGNISNVRIVKGTAVYTSSFTPSTTPLTAIANTSLLTCRSYNFKDESTNNFAITRNGDVKVSPFIPFVLPSNLADLGSAFFDGSGDYVAIADNVALRPGTSDFTIEFWAYHNSVSGTQVYVGKGGLSAGGSWLVEKGTNQGWGFQVNASSTIQTSTIAGSYVGFWFHIAVTRSGSTLRFFLDGTLMDTRTVSTDLAITSEVQIGNQSTYGWAFNGWMSNLRIVKGTALYTANFTPPTTPLTAVTNTSLLTLQNNQPINNNVFVDKSGFNNVVNRFGNPTQGTFSPYGDNWSNYFDGTGDFLSLSSTAADLGSGDFTAEVWLYTGTISDGVIIDTRDTSSTSGWVWHLSTNGTFVVGLNGSAIITTTNSIVANTWNHVALVRNGTTVRVYINGVSTSTGTSGSAFTPFNFNIGQKSWTSSGVGNFIGYMSNLRIVRGTALYTTNFTPSTVPLQPVNNTRLLTCRDGSFVDDGPNNFAITRNGDVRVTKFSPFLTSRVTTPYYSAFFDGVDDYLNIANNTIVNFGTSDFTAEAWVYLTTVDTTVDTIIGNYNNGSNGGFGWYINRGTNGGIQVYSGNSLVVNANLAVTSGSWNHVAVCRSSGTTRIFVNGTSVANASDTNNYGADNSATGIGGTPPGAGAGAYFPGYISNVRVIKGTALYTTNFTPSTTPLTAVANTSLLTCTSNTFVDISNNRFAITASGNPRPTLFSPFTVSYTTKEPYSASTFGGSMFFDGTGDYLTIDNNMSVGANNFTVQGWVYPTAWTVEWNSVISTRPTSSTGGFSNVFVLGVHNSGYPYIYSGDMQITGAAGAVRLGNWTHLCVTRSGNTMRMFVNGALANTTTTLQNYTVSSGAVGANRNGSEQWTGYLSDVSLIGGEAIYTSAFVPPLNTVTAANNTLLLLNGTDAAIFDSSTKNDIETVGDVRLNASIKKYGNTSIFFDGTGDYIRNSQPDLLNDISGANFTIEFWVYFTSLATDQALVSKYGNAAENGGGLGYVLQWVQSSSALRLVLGIGGGSDNLYPWSWTPVTSTWYHVAVTRSGTSARAFINGTQIGSTTTVTTSDTVSPNSLQLGKTHTVSQHLSGYIDDFRLTKGYARYTNNFTPPGKLSTR